MSYGSRTHKIVSIFRRVDGLIKNGAISHSERPLWFDVYRAFPPKIEPIFERPLPKQHVREILYNEDLGRSAFMKNYVDEDLHNLFNVEDNGTVISKFIAKGHELNCNWEDLECLNRVREALQQDGFLVEEKKKFS